MTVSKLAIPPPAAGLALGGVSWRPVRLMVKLRTAERAATHPHTRMPRTRLFSYGHRVEWTCDTLMKCVEPAASNCFCPRGPGSAPAWELLDGDRVGYLEGKEEIVRHVEDQTLQILPAGERVVGRVHTHGLDDLAVLAEAIALESGLGQLAAVFAAVSGVKLAQPALVLSRGRAKVSAHGGEFRRVGLYLVAVEGGAIGRRRAAGRGRREGGHP